MTLNIMGCPPSVRRSKFFKTKMAGRLVGPSHIWPPPSILGVYFADFNLRQDDLTHIIHVFDFFLFVYGICGKMGMWVHTRSDDGVGVAWQFLFCEMSLIKHMLMFVVFYALNCLQQTCRLYLTLHSLI